MKSGNIHTKRNRYTQENMLYDDRGILHLQIKNLGLLASTRYYDRGMESTVPQSSTEGINLVNT